MNNFFRLYLVIFVCSNIAVVHCYNSQIGQDKYVNERFIKNKKNGVFVDIGAYDGIDHSNTYFFEKELNWSGICFEPMPDAFKLLRKNRGCICLNACAAAEDGFSKFIEVSGAPDELSGLVHSYDPRHLERLKKEVKERGGSYKIIDVVTLNFNKVMREYGIKKIDYLSIDTEGSELEILKSINFDEFEIHIITIENNYGEAHFRNFLQSKGFRLVEYLMGQDEIYVNTKYY